MTQLHISRYVDCPFSAAIELAEKAVSQRNGFYLTPSPPLVERVRFAAATTADATDDVRKHDALLIAWRPQTRGMFPDFRGVLTVRPERRGVRLRLDGQYEPPYGAPGSVFDFFVGRAIARRTMLRLLDEFAADIESEYDRERRTNKTATTGE